VIATRIFGRLLGATASAALLLSLLAAPASATSSARWVDDDLTAGDGPDQCDTASYTGIQLAIDESSAGDWVYVCPGIYLEELVIPAGVKVRARPLLGAEIQGPAAGTGNLIELTGDNAQLRGFSIKVFTNSAPATLGPSFEVCAHYDTAVLVRGSNDYVRNNRIIASGDDTLSGACGFDYGIVVGQHADSATASVTFNWVTDFKIGGILVEDADSYAYVRRNTLRFFHEHECNAVSFTSCAITVRPSVNGGFFGTFGIGVESGARADIIRNAISSGPNACSTGPSYSCSLTATPTMNDGISLLGLNGSETTDIHDNVVRRTLGGIVTRADADGAVIYDNWVYAAHYGYQVSGDNDEWHDNHTSGNDYGISVTGSGNNIHDNDFRGNLGTDCYDGTSGSGTADTANTWTDNLGNLQVPEGICTPDA
jgi:hypothetical protein